MTKLCRHFGTCGGCTYQDMPEDAYRAFKRESVLAALARHGLDAANVDDIVAVGEGTRRRASFKVAKANGVVALGFHAATSHTIVDMHECRLLTPSLFALVAPLRALMGEMLADGEKAELFVTETDNGADVAISWKRKRDPATMSILARAATRAKLARITVNGEPVVELASPQIRFGAVSVILPPESFLQPTVAGEAALQERVLRSLEGAKSAADLFSGLGTFALVAARNARVHAVESDKVAIEALAEAARKAKGLKPVTTERRDLFKHPLAPAEIDRFDAVILDPPRIGASAQVKALARSKVRRIVYVSCNPESFARDARTLCDGGHRMGTVTPVDQFLWSSHIELVAAFARG